MGKSKFNFLRPENSFRKFQVPFCFCVFLLSFGSWDAEDQSGVYRSELDPTFFAVRENSGLSWGGLFTTRKNFPPSYGAWFEFPFWKRDRKHFWKTSFLYENHRVVPTEISAVHRTYAGLQGSFFSGENFLRPSFFVGWERGEKDLCVFGVYLEIPDKQTIQVFGKAGENFKTASFFLHSPFSQEFRLFLGVTRTWNGSQTEDQWTLGIGISWEKFSSSFFGNRIGEEESFLTGKFGVNHVSQDGLEPNARFESANNFESRSFFGSKNSDPSKGSDDTKSKHKSDLSASQDWEKDKTKGPSPIRRYTIFSFSIQELLSAGFPLSSALKIHRASSRSREEFSDLFDSLSEKEQTKLFVLLKKKNPKPKRVNSFPSEEKR
ncbi:hypothetical protein [Leptospira weilii]|uniref:hypothetical protein n=1 Tax=Leptospira weilii TaxID=28184 RepID=UPI00056875FE|nr:hypothetical protein [Leptospira weilii]